MHQERSLAALVMKYNQPIKNNNNIYCKKTSQLCLYQDFCTLTTTTTTTIIIIIIIIGLKNGTILYLHKVMLYIYIMYIYNIYKNFIKQIKVYHTYIYIYICATTKWRWLGTNLINVQLPIVLWISEINSSAQSISKMDCDSINFTVQFLIKVSRCFYFYLFLFILLLLPLIMTKPIVNGYTGTAVQNCCS